LSTYEGSSVAEVQAEPLETAMSLMPIQQRLAFDVHKAHIQIAGQVIAPWSHSRGRSPARIQLVLEAVAQGGQVRRFGLHLC